MTPPLARRRNKVVRRRNCSLNWHWKICLGPRNFFGQSMRKRMGWTDGYPWKCRRSWHTTLPVLSPRPKSSFGERMSPICSSRFPAPKKGFRPLKRRSIRAYRLTRSEEHTSELQSLAYLVCRLLLEKKKLKRTSHYQLRLSNSTAD